MDSEPINEPSVNPPLDYRSASSAAGRAEVRRTAIKRVVVWVAVAAVALGVGAAIAIPLIPQRPRPNFLRSMCALNMKNIAAALITYSGAHQGHYPDSFEELFVSSGMSSAIFVCPESNDNQAVGTIEQQTAALSAGGHCSYIYIGKGLTADGSTDTVVCYEPLTNHHGEGMNVLFNDYHVSWIPGADAKKLIASIVPGKPTIWPPKGGK